MHALNRPNVQKTEQHGTYQVIHPRNALKAKAAVAASPNLAVIDEDAIARAESAVQDLAPEFFGWMNEQVLLLTAARTSLWSDGIQESTTEALFRATHEIRGSAGTFGFPLASRVAESLVYLIEKIGLVTTPKLLIDQHVDAIRAIVREDARGSDDLIGKQLVQRLAIVTARFIEMREARLAG